MATASPEERAGLSRDLRALLTYLVDAYQCSMNMADYRKKLDEAGARLKKDIVSADSLRTYTDDLIRNGNSMFGQDTFGETGSKIGEFSTAALEQFKARMTTASNQKIAEIGESVSSEKMKFLKDMEAYLSTLTQPIIQNRLSVRWHDGSYEARATYSVSTKFSPSSPQQRRGLLKPREVQNQVVETLSIEYQFLLRADDIDLFSNTLYFSDFEKGIKIPVRHAVSWVTKEAVVDSERADRYFLNSAELSGNALIAEFADKDRDAKFKLVYHTGDSENFLNVEYSDGAGSVDVSSQSVLNQSLDSAKLKGIMNQIYTATAELVNHRSRLVSFSVNSEDVLSMDNASLVLSAMIRFLSSFYGRALSDAISDRPDAGSGNVTSEFVRSRLQLVGDASPGVNEMLQRNFSVRPLQ